MKTGATTTPTDVNIQLTDITTNNASTSKHGFQSKLSNVATQYLDGTGLYSVPAGSGTSLGLVEAISMFKIR